MGADAVFDVPEGERPRLAGLIGGEARSIAVRTDNGDVELPPAAGRAVRELLAQLAAGNAVHLVPADAELTTQQAADLLGISRTYVVRLIDDGKLPAHLVGTHRRLKAADVLAYRARRSERLAAARAITDADVVAGVPYR
ncbi:MAG: helix-turn-helix domain-containing protein [Acidimicrobiia bacterium]